jgi:hypothetical protein
MKGDGEQEKLRRRREVEESREGVPGGKTTSM